MTFARSFVLNFLLVFFVNHIAPGIHIDFFQGVANLGADLVFSFTVGLLNAAIFPALRFFRYKVTPGKILLIAAGISFGAYGFIWIFPLGVIVSNFFGFFFAGAAVTVVAFFTNYMEMKHFS